jgi:predicted amidohydrolase YtcJ
VIDRNLFEVDELDGGFVDGKVTLTMVGGEVVYESSGP